VTRAEGCTLIVFLLVASDSHRGRIHPTTSKMPAS
jgi:hypothetical protein